MFHSSISFSMDLGCPLLRGSFVRRLRRRAATDTTSKVNGSCELTYFLLCITSESDILLCNLTQLIGNPKIYLDVLNQAHVNK